MSPLGETAAIVALQQIQGASFASVDTETHPKPGIKKVVKNQQVLLFGKSGQYEAMVKRRLAEVGKNPDNFVASDLPWGSHVGDSPLVTHKDRLYVQCVIIQPGGVKYYRETPFGDREVNPKDYNIKDRVSSQGLPEGQEVVVATYNIENIKRITVGAIDFT